MKPHNSREDLEDSLDDYGISYDPEIMELVQVDFSNLNNILPTEEDLETNFYVHLTLRLLNPETTE